MWVLHFWLWKYKRLPNTFIQIHYHDCDSKMYKVDNIAENVHCNDETQHHIYMYRSWEISNQNQIPRPFICSLGQIKLDLLLYFDDETMVKLISSIYVPINCSWIPCTSLVSSQSQRAQVPNFKIQGCQEFERIIKKFCQWILEKKKIL